MGYRGKVREQEEARRLRAQGWILSRIAEELRVSKSSVSLWVRDVPFTPSKRRYGPQARYHPWQTRKLREIEEMREWGLDQLGRLSEKAFLAPGAALYAGEGSKTGHAVVFANTDPTMVRFFCAWLRRFFDVDESRLRVRVYLHQGLDLDAAEQFWADVTDIPRSQFGKPYRAVADSSIRKTKHEHGCVYVSYSCARVLRGILG